MATLEQDVQERIERLAGEAVASARRVSGGYTPAGRWLLTLRSGRTAFAKIGTTPHTAGALRSERAVYGTLSAPCVPRCLGWQDHPANPILLLEDLSTARWPPPWDDALIARARAAIDALHATTADLKPFAEVHGNLSNGWQDVASDPTAFLSLGMVSEAWLRGAQSALLDAGAQVSGEGSDTVHLDLRSDNLCATERGVLLIDWNAACIGNGALDLGFWLPSLQAEGGPAPERILPRRPDIAAYVSGYFAARAGLPAIPDAPRVRTVQLQQLKTALPWACRELGLPAPDLSA